MCATRVDAAIEDHNIGVGGSNTSRTKGNSTARADSASPTNRARAKAITTISRTIVAPDWWKDRG